jgi:hypothetical protein
MVAPPLQPVAGGDLAPLSAQRSKVRKSQAAH